MARIDVKGDIITNDYGWIYELFEWDCIYPKKVMDIIDRYGLPQDWNDDGSHGPERYIEAQVWTDEPIKRYSIVL